MALIFIMPMFLFPTPAPILHSSATTVTKGTVTAPARFHPTPPADEVQWGDNGTCLWNKGHLVPNSSPKCSEHSPSSTRSVPASNNIAEPTTVFTPDGTATPKLRPPAITGHIGGGPEPGGVTIDLGQTNWTTQQFVGRSSFKLLRQGEPIVTHAILPNTWEVCGKPSSERNAMQAIGYFMWLGEPLDFCRKYSR